MASRALGSRRAHFCPDRTILSVYAGGEIYDGLRRRAAAEAELRSRASSLAGIAALVEATIENAQGRGIMREPVDVDDAIAVDHDSRSLAQSLLPQIAVKAF